MPCFKGETFFRRMYCRFKLESEPSCSSGMAKKVSFHQGNKKKQRQRQKGKTVTNSINKQKNGEEKGFGPVSGLILSRSLSHSLSDSQRDPFLGNFNAKYCFRYETHFYMLINTAADYYLKLCKWFWSLFFVGFHRGFFEEDTGGKVWTQHFTF